jgi:hypothetical protein
MHAFHFIFLIEMCIHFVAIQYMLMIQINFSKNFIESIVWSILECRWIVPIWHENNSEGIIQFIPNIFSKELL